MTPVERVQVQEIVRFLARFFPGRVTVRRLPGGDYVFEVRVKLG